MERTPPRVLGRREALVMLGLGGLGVAALWRTPRAVLRALWAAITGADTAAAAQCVLTPEQTAPSTSPTTSCGATSPRDARVFRFSSA
jgi:hypothetical protein